MAVTTSSIEGVVSLALKVRQLGENLYNASSSLDDFKSDVAKLRMSFEAWERRARTFGISHDASFSLSIQEAKDQLQREESRLMGLDKGCGCVRCLWLSLGTTFPAELGKSIANLNEMIRSNERFNEDANNEAQKIAERLARSLTFGFKRDWRYVRIHSIEQKLKQLLSHGSTREKTSRVISLYGRAGCGKSSMARHLALDFKEAANPKVLRAATMNAAGSEEPNVDGAEGPYTERPGTSYAQDLTSSGIRGFCGFEDVFYLECGPRADLEANCEQLLSKVLWDNPMAKANMKKYKEEGVTKCMLSQMLHERRSLLVLDDVWEEHFLKEMVGVCGHHMKILVTTQKKRLCDFQCLLEEAEAVPMDALTQDESCNILKKHSGCYDGDEVPMAVKNYMDKLVEKVDGHPHALASIGARIDAEYKEEQSQWNEICRVYEALLDSKDRHGNLLQDVPYERSVTGAIELKFEPLGQEEKQILVMMAMSRGPGTPQYVIQLLHHELFVQDKREGARSSMTYFSAR